MDSNKKRSMKASIIIPAFNRWEYTKKCLESLFLHLNEDVEEIIVVNNGSTDQTKKELEKEHRVKAIINSKNLLFAKACNQGAAAARGGVLVFLNNDTKVTKNWLKPILTCLQKPGNAIAGPKLVFPDGSLQHGGTVISNDLTPRHLHYRGNSDSEYVNKARYFQSMTGACMAVKSDVFMKVNGFDEEYQNGLEDVDLCLRVSKLGYKICYAPDSTVIHYESVSEGRFNYNKHNSELFLKLWTGKIKPDEEKYLKEDGFSWFKIKRNHLENIFAGGSLYDWRRGPLFQVAKWIYLFPRRIKRLISNQKSSQEIK